MGLIEEKYRDGAAFLEKAVRIIEQTGVKIVDLKERYAKILMPFAPNINHIGTMYGGSLFILAEFSGGVIYYASFDYTRFYPIIKDVSIRYRRPATTDVTLEVRLSPEEVEAIEDAADKDGKKDWSMNLELKDAHEEVCCVVQGTWQLRKFPDQNQ
ncbi:MAG TPA: DUF4442 domain-containing protein [Deltaproteobacteria bacterium]|nr:DUF4442 domain-containing protein [Deltaproteobacteria bacterium]